MPPDTGPADLPTPSADDRYVALSTGERAVLLYDRERPTAWIRSDAAVTTADNR